MSLVSQEQFNKNLLSLQTEVARICQETGRSPSEIEILAVTKVHPVEAWQYALEAGLSAIGENRVQEGAQKREMFSHPERLRKDLIGHLQSNKAKLAVHVFDRIQSVDTLKLAQKLSQAAEGAGKTLSILLQVNTDLDEAKSGIAPEQLLSLLEEVQVLPALQIDGLMTIGRLTDDFDEQRKTFSALRMLCETARQASGLTMPVLSMGMSGDITAAIQEGSTQIRVGTALFGARG